MIGRIIAAAVLSAALPSAAMAQKQRPVLRQEPGEGQLRAGHVIYVDDGSCPEGWIKKVTGGSNISWVTGQVMSGGRSRQRACVRAKP